MVNKACGGFDYLIRASSRSFYNRIGMRQSQCGKLENSEKNCRGGLKLLSHKMGRYGRERGNVMRMDINVDGRLASSRGRDR